MLKRLSTSSLESGVKFSFRAISLTPVTGVRFHSAVPKDVTGSTSSTSKEELAHFAQLAESWWDVNGPQRILHKMNLLRVDYIRDILERYTSTKGCPPYGIPGYNASILPADLRPTFDLSKLSLDVLDIGCGGGILCESLARLPMTRSVLGIDLSPEVIEVAKHHKDESLEHLSYSLVELNRLNENRNFDVVTMFEMLEHVNHPSEMLDEALARVRPGGWLFLSTINRTPVSYFTTILMGEKVLKIVPEGTHTWSKYIDESELRQWFHDHHQGTFQVVNSSGCLYIPAYGWTLTGDRSIGNYMMAIRRVDW